MAKNSRKHSRSFKRHGSRFKARHRAAAILFEAEIRDLDPVAIIEDRINLSKIDTVLSAPVPAYTQQIVAGVAEQLDRIDEIISAHLAEEWTLERIPAVDRAILRVGLWEMLFNEELDAPIVVVEAVELASYLSTDQSPAYINALLDAVVRNIDDVVAGKPATEEIFPEVDAEGPEALLSATDISVEFDDDFNLDTEIASDVADAELIDGVENDSEDITTMSYTYNESAERD
ncbi:N utilization substance protein B [Corynebacterium kutscheri]|uniref:Transcription antitermination protein NusB n=1 Tax=Corynebacterium kutscheri TaxID=35755 RepID=A0A0F6R1Y7_9CORY|nr:transcription antitermination factor NusB [Corynebacterium kutscheri]AKE41313.1 NusB antitermination factor [Corynebacterium kutscheri]VEH08589.1 N utilization substance protein B [Corynebacterium kutscheri]VEH09635.1 N utilization substance protein B [Corynebacterium kutscheri]VEH79718.1 N utilization substance protein B [Corynebacterium kutscheri]